MNEHVAEWTAVAGVVIGLFLVGLSLLNYYRYKTLTKPPHLDQAGSALVAEGRGRVAFSATLGSTSTQSSCSRNLSTRATSEEEKVPVVVPQSLRSLK